MRAVLFSFLLLSSISTQAADQLDLNSIYSSVGQEVQDALQLKDASLEEVSLWSIVENERLKKADKAQAFQKMSVQLDPLVYSKSWEFMFRLNRLSATAAKSLQKLSQLEMAGLNQDCNSKMKLALQSIADSEYLNNEKMRASDGSMEMDTDAAMRFLGVVTKGGRSFSQYLNQGNPDASTLIERGKEIELTVGVVQMTLLNQPVAEELSWAAEDLINGCSE